MRTITKIFICALLIFALVGSSIALDSLVINAPREIDLTKATPQELEKIEITYNAQINNEYMNKMIQNIYYDLKKLKEDGNVEGIEQIYSLTTNLTS